MAVPASRQRPHDDSAVSLKIEGVPPRKVSADVKEPLILWWMPVLSLLAPLVFAAWRAASASDGLDAALKALVWPGAGLYLAAVAVLWAGWKIELE